VKRPGADGTVERPSDDHSLCAVSLTAQQDSSSATITGDAWSKLRRAQRSDGVNQGTLALILRSCTVCCSGAGCQIDRRMEVCWARLCGEKCCSIYTVHASTYLYQREPATTHPSSSPSSTPLLFPSDLMHAARDTGTCRRRCQMSSLRAVSTYKRASEILDRLRHACPSTPM